MGYINVLIDEETHLRLNLVCKAMHQPIRKFVPEQIKKTVNEMFNKIKEGKGGPISDEWIKIIEKMESR